MIEEKINQYLTEERGYVNAEAIPSFHNNKCCLNCKFFKQDDMDGSGYCKNKNNQKMVGGKDIYILYNQSTGGCPIHQYGSSMSYDKKLGDR